MVALVPVLALALTVIVLIAVRVLRHGTAYYYLINLGGVVLSWVSMIALRPFWNSGEITISSVYANRQVEEIILRLDHTSWTFGFIALTIYLSSLLISTIRFSDTHWYGLHWGTLVSANLLTTTIMVSTAVGNLFTLMIVWGAGLLLEYTVRWIYCSSEAGLKSEQPLAITRLMSLTGIFIIYLTTQPFDWNPSGFPLTEIATLILTITSVLPVLAAAQIHSNSNDDEIPRILKPILVLASLSPYLMLLNRTAQVGASVDHLNFWLALICLPAAHSAFFWFRSETIESWRPWIIVTGIFCAAAALSNRPEACLSWGAALLLIGAFLMIRIQNPIWLLPADWLVMIGLTSLPYTPLWLGAALYQTAQPIWIPFLMIQSLLLTGFWSSRRTVDKNLPWQMRYDPAVYGLGLGFLSGTWIWLSVLPLASQPPLSTTLLLLQSLLPGFLVLGFTVVFIFLLRFQPRMVRTLFEVLERLFNIHWIIRIFYRLTTWAAKLFLLFNRLLESQAGLLWAVLILVLLYTIIGQQVGGS